MANSKSKTRKKVLIFSLILVVVAGLTTAAVMRKREPVITIQVEKVAKRNLTELVVANGKIQPVLQVKISPEVSGEIIELPVKEGQKVKKGDLLVKIKPDVYVAARNSSDASFKSAIAGRMTAEASLEKAAVAFKRTEALFVAKLVPDSSFTDDKAKLDIAKAQLDSAVHQVEMAQAALDRAIEDLSKTTIVSPLDGTVSRLNSQLGERVVGTAMMAGTEIMTIADLNEMEARVDIGEIDVVLIGVGQHARLEVDAYKDRKFNGTVTEIANSSKGLGTASSSGSSQEATKFEVKIRVQEKEEFRPGMSVTAEIETRTRTNVLTVPIASVTTRAPKDMSKDGKPGSGGKGQTNSAAASTNTAASSTNALANNVSTNTSSTNSVAGGGTHKPGDAIKPIEVVFLKEGDRAKMVSVKRGISDDSYTEITEGVKEGQDVVSGGYKAISRELEDGKKVRIGVSKVEMAKEQK